MLSPIIIIAGWISQLLVGFYIIRAVSNPLIRCISTLIPCAILTYFVAYDLPALYMPSMLLVTFCWLASIRLFHLIVLSPNQCRTFLSFILKILHLFFPIVPCTSYQHQQWPIHYDIISAGLKIIVNHWMYRWLLICTGSDSYPRLIMFYIFILTYSFLADIQSAIVRMITRDRYMLRPITNLPFLSQSLREFWGRRYNQHVGVILRESIFQPVLHHISSPTLASLSVFLISALLHIHLALVTFKDSRSTLSTLIFFLLHGVGCSIETHAPFRIPPPWSWFFTQFFLLLTASLQIGSFTRIGPKYYAANTPPLFDQYWIPKLPVFNFCPQ